MFFGALYLLSIYGKAPDSIEASGAGELTLTGSSTSKVIITGAGASTITITGSASGKAYATGTLVSSLPITGESSGKVFVTGLATGVIGFDGISLASATGPIILILNPNKSRTIVLYK